MLRALLILFTATVHLTASANEQPPAGLDLQPFTSEVRTWVAQDLRPRMCAYAPDNLTEQVAASTFRPRRSGTLRDSINAAKAKVRSVWKRMDCRSEADEFGIELLPGSRHDLGNDFVVLVHGLNSRPEELVGLLSAIPPTQFIRATFRYPNDQPIIESAALLSAELSRLYALFPDRRIRLIAHSMGGLVSRCVLEFPELDPGNVDQLIMLGTPNQGSTLAHVAMFMDCYEYCFSKERRNAAAFVSSVTDGLGEASADLKPGSSLLQRLNARQRNEAVRYTILLGTGGPMSQSGMSQLRRDAARYTNYLGWFRFTTAKLNRALNDLDEIVAGKGDGAVSVDRGRLAGVTDTVVLTFDHMSVLSPALPASREAHAVIRDRLSR